jgi:hypothetical protein
LLEEQSLESLEKAKQIVDEILPYDNFFAYKEAKKMDKEQKKLEMGEIKRIIRLSKENSNYYVEDNDDSYLQPVFQDKNSTEMVISSINTILAFCRKQVDHGITEYRIHSGD